MSSPRYKRHAGGVSTLHYHFVWCPKYRRAVLVGSVADRLTTLLYEKAQALATQIEALEIMPDHVHLFVCAPPTEAPQHLVNQFKGYTSRVLRTEFPRLKSRLPSLWSRSYYVGSAGHVSADTIQKYIEQQKRS
jgi:putative transposase